MRFTFTLLALAASFSAASANIWKRQNLPSTSRPLPPPSRPADPPPSLRRELHRERKHGRLQREQRAVPLLQLRLRRQRRVLHREELLRGRHPGLPASR